MTLRVLLVGDRRFVEADNAVYTEGPMGAETGACYLKQFDTVTVAGRRGNVAEFRPERLNLMRAAGTMGALCDKRLSAGALPRRRRCSHHRLFGC